MNTLQIAPKKTVQDLHQLLQQVPKQPQPERNFAYLSHDRLQQQFDTIHDTLFKETATEQDRESCKEIAKGFTYVIPHVDRYELCMNRIQISDQVLRRFYTPQIWDVLPDKNRNQIRRFAEKYQQSVDYSLAELTAFVNRQSLHLDKMTETEQELVMDLETPELDVKVANEIRTYFKPADTLDDRYLMTCKQAAVNLAKYTDGNLYMTPQEMAKTLELRGFVRSEKANAYFIQLVK